MDHHFSSAIYFISGPNDRLPLLELYLPLSYELYKARRSARKTKHLFSAKVSTGENILPITITVRQTQPAATATATCG